MRKKALKLGVAAVLAAVPHRSRVVASAANSADVASQREANIVNPPGGDPDGSATVILQVNRVKQRGSAAPSTTGS